MKSISEGVVIGSNTLKSEKWLENREKVAKNITNYINSPHAGHKRYGFGYLLAQVVILKIKLRILIFSFHNSFVRKLSFFSDIEFNCSCLVLLVHRPIFGPKIQFIRTRLDRII